MYTKNELEEALATIHTEGWTVIEKHIKETIAVYTERLIDSSDTEDEKLKGNIQALKNDVLSLPFEFQKMLENEVERQKEIEEAAKVQP
jgi:hypothetical protein